MDDFCHLEIPVISGLTGFSGETERHRRFYMAGDGFIFQVEDILFRVPYYLLAEGGFFRTMLEENHRPSSLAMEGITEDHPIRPQGITVHDLESLLIILTARHIDGPLTLSIRQLGGALLLSTMWAFDKVREWIIQELDKRSLPPVDRIDLAMKCSVQRWLLPAYLELCTREGHLTLQEAVKLGIVNYHTVSRIREQYHVRLAARCNLCNNQNKPGRKSPAPPGHSPRSSPIPSKGNRARGFSIVLQLERDLIAGLQLGDLPKSHLKR